MRLVLGQALAVDTLRAATGSHVQQAATATYYTLRSPSRRSRPCPPVTAPPRTTARSPRTPCSAQLRASCPHHGAPECCLETLTCRTHALAGGIPGTVEVRRSSSRTAASSWNPGVDGLRLRRWQAEASIHHRHRRRRRERQGADPLLLDLVRLAPCALELTGIRPARRQGSRRRSSSSSAYLGSSSSRRTTSTSRSRLKSRLRLGPTTTVRPARSRSFCSCPV